jgi:hypothetical protein
MTEDLANSTIFTGGGADTCQSLGCGYHSGASCQCDSTCAKYSNCCADYAMVCGGGGNDSTCKGLGCGYHSGAA